MESKTSETNKNRKSIAIPSIPFKGSPNLILVITLIIFSFLLGMLTNKVMLLEKGVSTTSAQTVPQAQAPRGNTQPQAQQPVAQAPTGKIKEVTDQDHIRGNKNAKVTLVEYSDYECPYCKSFHPTMQELMKTYGDKIRWVYRDYPLPFHQNAPKEAEASECIAELGGEEAFWKYTDTIFERTTSNGTGFALDKLGPLASELGIDQTAFQECLDSGKYEPHVKDQTADGNGAGVNGTPSTFLVDANGKTQLIVGAQPIEAFKTEIDKVLK